MSSLRFAHGPPIVIGDGPAISPSTETIEPAGVVDTAILHGPVPNVGEPPAVSPGSSTGSVGVTSATTAGRGAGCGVVERCGAGVFAAIHSLFPRLPLAGNCGGGTIAATCA